MSSSSLKAERSSKKESLNKYKKRKTCTEKVIRAIDNNLDDDIRSINGKAQLVETKLEQAIKIDGTGVTTTIPDDKEALSGTDANICSSRSYLSSEVSHCQSRINQLESEIRSLDSQIARAEEQERAERLAKISKALGLSYQIY